jgi:CheY-like chemotaxis protein
MQHLFDPFFTTKPLGKGAGLGLSTVRQIVERRGGAVWATSLPGNGATFHVCLPRAAEHADTRDAKPVLRPHQGRSELVLVVEDEESVRNLLTQILTMRGYQVATAADGEEALRIFDERASEIQLVVTDVIMPKIGGPELAERLLARRPELGVIFMSGYPDDHLSGSHAVRQGRRFLRKPLLPDALCSAVREALDTPGLPFNRRQASI